VSVVSRISRTLIDFVLPQDCILCGKETPHALICSNCLEYLPVIRSPQCRVCGRPSDDSDICAYCTDTTSIDHGRAWLCFIPPANTLIHHFKYRKKTHLATLLGRAMASIIQVDPLLKKADIIAPVPLHWFKRLRRGYNQSFLLARVVADNTGIAVRNVLKRKRYTKSQTQLTDTIRRENVSGAFAITENKVKNKRILLVDDVLTTGATMNECARVLKQAGAAAVYSCVAAITP
jgi:competence protein ComFC